MGKVLSGTRGGTSALGFRTPAQLGRSTAQGRPPPTPPPPRLVAQLAERFVVGERSGKSGLLGVWFVL